MTSLQFGYRGPLILLAGAAAATLVLVGYLYLRAISGHPAVDLAVRQVGALYGDPHPTVLHVDYSKTDWTPQEDLADVTMRGHFRLGPKRADEIYFNLLVQKHIVFGLSGLNHAGRAVWSHPGQIILPATL